MLSSHQVPQNFPQAHCSWGRNFCIFFPTTESSALEQRDLTASSVISNPQECSLLPCCVPILCY